MADNLERVGERIDVLPCSTQWSLAPLLAHERNQQPIQHQVGLTTHVPPILQLPEILRADVNVGAIDR